MTATPEMLERARRDPLYPVAKSLKALFYGTQRTWENQPDEDLIVQLIRGMLFPAVGDDHSDLPWFVQKRGDTPSHPYIVAVTADPDYHSNVPSMMITRGETTGGTGWPAIGVGGIPWEEAEGNARLIVAAVNERWVLRAGRALLLEETKRLRAMLRRFMEVIDAGDDLSNADVYGTEHTQARALLED